MLPRTFAGVHFYQFLYERSISLQNLFCIDVTRDFAAVHYHPFLYKRSITLQSLFYFDVNRDFAGVHYHPFLYERSITLQSLFYFDVNRDFFWRALRSISLREKNNSSEPVLFLCYHELLLVYISINFFTREA